MPGAADRPRVLVVGTGRVARALAGGWRRAGFDVTFASRDPDGPSAVAARAAAPGAAVRPAEDAVATADVVVLAVPFAAAAATAATLAAAHPAALAGVVLVDATNPMPTAPAGAASGAALVAAAAPRARVVKAFNTVGAEVMADPTVAGRPVDLLVAGDDADATATVGALAAALGFTPIVVGGLALAAEVEALARLWITLAMRRGHGRRAAFAWIREPA